MFIMLNQLRSGDPVCIDVNNIKDFMPETIFIDEVERTGTLIELYRGGDPWIVSQRCYEVIEVANKAKAGAL
jgi:hypothetical protein